MYDKQVAANEISIRIKKVAKRQVTNSTADRIAEAIQAEGTVDPKTIRVMIKDGVDDKFKEVETKKKKLESASRK